MTTRARFERELGKISWNQGGKKKERDLPLFLACNKWGKSWKFFLESAWFTYHRLLCSHLKGKIGVFCGKLSSRLKGIKRMPFRPKNVGSLCQLWGRTLEQRCMLSNSHRRFFVIGGTLKACSAMPRIVISSHAPFYEAWVETIRGQVIFKIYMESLSLNWLLSAASYPIIKSPRKMYV